MNLPNKLTVLRIIMVPFFVFFMLADFIPYRFLYAFLLFSVASYTDRLDGQIARKRGLITNFGKLMDPLADKILVMAALICFVKLDLASTACVIIIMFREFAVTSIRLIAVEQGKVIAANNWGKAKTVSQMVAIITILVLQTAMQFTAGPGMGFVMENMAIAVHASVILAIGEVLIYIATLLTLISGVIYVRDSAELFQDM